MLKVSQLCANTWTDVYWKMILRIQTFDSVHFFDFVDYWGVVIDVVSHGVVRGHCNLRWRRDRSWRCGSTLRRHRGHSNVLTRNPPNLGKVQSKSMIVL